MSFITVSQFNHMLEVYIDDNVVYLAGAINHLLSPWSETLHGYVIGTLPSAFKPERRLVFMTYSNELDRIDITPEGHIIVMSEDKPITYVNLTGIHFSLSPGKHLKLFNGWSKFGKPYRDPSFSRHGSVVYLSGMIRGGLQNKLFAKLPDGYRPLKKLLFRALNNTPNGPIALIEILPDGDCSIFVDCKVNSGILFWYSLDGIDFPIASLKQAGLDLPESWVIHRNPSLFVNNNLIHFNGVISRKLKNHSPSPILAKINPKLAPHKTLRFHVVDMKKPPKLVPVDITPDGYIKLLTKSGLNHICLDNISYVKNQIRNNKNVGFENFQIGGADNNVGDQSTVNDQVIGSLDGYDKYVVDGAQNIEFIDLNSKITQDGTLSEWSADIGRPGTTLLQVYRPVQIDQNTGNGTYKLIGEYSYDFKTNGITNVNLPTDFQIPVKTGDFIGWRFPGLGTIKYKTGAGNVKWLYGNPPNVGQSISFNVGDTRTYAYTIKISYNEQIIQANQDKNVSVNPNVIGSSSKIPAHSAQQIIEEYKKLNLPYPPDGTYWIRAFDSKPAQQIYCSFSIRKGYGYMLVASVDNQKNWLPIASQSVPLNPNLNYGTYQADGKVGNYYRPWSDLDLNTIIDNEPSKCQSFGYNYSTTGQFCGVQTTNGLQRLDLNDGISELMFITGNGKYWIIISRKDLLGRVDKEVWKKINLVDSSKNFEGSCNPNQFAYIVARPGFPEDPIISAGDAYKCDNNYTFWAMNNSDSFVEFKNNNGGIQMFVGGNQTNPVGANSQIPHDPIHIREDDKGPYSSTYQDAVAVCALRGQKVCSREELELANKAGYSSCACGWTDTKIGNKHWVGYPTNMETWTQLNRGPDPTTQGNKCGVPGLNQCDPPKSGQEKADIYCCDKYNFDNNFDLLDDDYVKAKLWIINAESLYNSLYGLDIPSPIDFLVYGEEGFGVSITKKGQTYNLINYDLCSAPKNLSNIRCQLPQLKPFGSDRVAVFLNDITTTNIIKGVIWPLKTGQKYAITYGSQIRLKNIFNTSYLTTMDLNYYHAQSGQKTEVMGTNNEDITSLWLLKTQRGSGKLDNQGYGDEKYGYGQPIKNGDILRLQSIFSQKNLHSNVTYLSPSGRQEIYVNEVGKLGDSNDNWRLELINSEIWTPESTFRLIHVNTNTVLFSDSTTYKPSQNSDLRYFEVSANKYRGPGDTWSISSYVLQKHKLDKCPQLSLMITKLNLQIKSSSKDIEKTKNLQRQKQALIKQYNQECRKLSVYDYKGQMELEEAQIKKLTDEYDQGQQRLTQLQTQWKLIDDQRKKLNNQYQITNHEYQKILHRCKPVLSCVTDAYNNSPLPAQCQSILDQLQQSNGLVTEQLDKQIKSVLVDTDKVTNYDIRNHRDFYKLAENTKIQRCPKPSSLS